MTLLNELRFLDADRALKIGSVDGTAFFYCGTAGEFVSKIEEFSERGERFFRENAEQATAELADVLKQRPEVPRECRRVLKEEFGSFLNDVMDCAADLERTPEKLKMLRYVAELGRWAGKVQKVRKKAMDNRRMYSEFVPYKERGVSDIFDAAPKVEPVPTTVIRIYGTECGRYWTRSEATGKPRFHLVSQMRTADGTEYEEDE